MGEVGTMSTLAPEISPWGLSPKKVDNNITTATNDWKGLRITVTLTIQKRQIQIKVVLSACSDHQSPQEPPRIKKKQKNIKRSRSSDLMRLSKLLDR